MFFIPRMSKKRKVEWQLFLNRRNPMTYNPLCRKCVCKCTQSYQAVVIDCLHYLSKRTKRKSPDMEKSRTVQSVNAQKIRLIGEPAFRQRPVFFRRQHQHGGKRFHHGALRGHPFPLQHLADQGPFDPALFGERINRDFPAFDELLKLF